LKTNKYIKMKV